MYNTNAALEYRLAPDSPFPAAVQDALSAYLYLLNPPADSGIAPVDPKNIVIMGDSAGGGKSLYFTLLVPTIFIGAHMYIFMDLHNFAGHYHGPNRTHIWNDACYP